MQTAKDLARFRALSGRIFDAQWNADGSPVAQRIMAAVEAEGIYELYLVNQYALNESALKLPR